MNKDVIIDLGAHRGEDSDFYLRKGFNVIAVDASEELCAHIKRKFNDHPENEHFQIFNFAISEKDNETISFFANVDNSVWGTIEKSWAKRNERFGTHSVERKISSVRLDTLIKQVLLDGGRIKYVKIDIEGADVTALKSLSNLTQMPEYVSIESEKVSWKKLKEEFAIFKSLGYTKFKVVNQAYIHQQTCPNPAREGIFVDYKFEHGSSGLFGAELPGEWLSAEEALSIYKKIFKRYKYFGDYGIFNNKWFMKNRLLNAILHRLNIKYPHVGWYDTHAALEVIN